MITPHKWDEGSKLWTCLGCGHVAPDQCDCHCHDLARDDHEHLFEYLEIDWGIFVWICECGEVEFS